MDVAAISFQPERQERRDGIGSHGRLPTAREYQK
jgi:hypothetical protein